MMDTSAKLSSIRDKWMIVTFICCCQGLSGVVIVGYMCKIKGFFDVFKLLMGKHA